MSLEQKIEALTAAIEANTAALTGGAKAPAAAVEKAAPAAVEKAAKVPKAEKSKPAAYEAKHTKSEAHAAVNEVKEKLGIPAAKAVIAEAGGTKLADIVTDEALDKLYDLSKAALGAEDGDDGADDAGI